MTSTKESLLGKPTNYIFHYNPDLLDPIERSAGRSLLGITEPLPFQGVDRWTAYEMSWLNSNGMPQVVIVEFDFPCTAPYLVESKSFKLYLNSFNQSVFATRADVETTLLNDLSKVCGQTIALRFFNVDNYRREPLKDFVCIDNLDVECTHYLPEPRLLKTTGVQTEKKLVSHLFRSLCPVTGQPDWASIIITYSGNHIDEKTLLHYLVSYRNHQGFHEQCVEQIFVDIMQHCQPQSLSVYGRFLRRGGLDINPFRATGLTPLSDIREPRQ